MVLHRAGGSVAAGACISVFAAAGPPDADRTDGNSPGDAGEPTGRAWLASLPAALAAQRRVMAGLVDRCEAWPLVRSLLVGCSLGRGAADALSDIDAALGVDAEPGPVGADRVATAEAMVVAALPDLGPLIDVLRHRTGTADQSARRIFAQFADGTQLDLAVVAQAASRYAFAAAALRTSSRCTRHPPRRAPGRERWPAAPSRAASHPPRTRLPAIRSGSGRSSAGAR